MNSYKTNNSLINNIQIIKYLLTIIVFMLITVFSIKFYITRLGQSLQENTTIYMEKIVNHDVPNVDNELAKQKEKLISIAAELKLNGFQTIEEMQAFLDIKSAVGGFEQLTLIDESNHTYCQSGLFDTGEKQVWLNDFKTKNDFFVELYKSKNTMRDWVGSLLYGIKFKPVTVGKTSIIGMTALADLASVRNSLKINFLGNQGSLQIINSEGYVVTSGTASADFLNQDFLSCRKI